MGVAQEQDLDFCLDMVIARGPLVLSAAEYKGLLVLARKCGKPRHVAKLIQILRNKNWMAVGSVTYTRDKFLEIVREIGDISCVPLLEQFRDDLIEIYMKPYLPDYSGQFDRGFHLGMDMYNIHLTIEACRRVR